MDASFLPALAAKLSLTVAVLTDYPPPVVPRVELLPAVEINRIVCTSPCNAQGAYLAERGILLAVGLDLAGDPRARAVLLHELVHQAQELAGAWSDLDPCERNLRREAEAYVVEHAYLRRFGLSGGTLAGPQRWHGAGCGTIEPESWSARATTAPPGVAP